MTVPKISTRQLHLLQHLCEAIAISGDEGEVRRIVLEQVRPLADEVRVDALGNVLALKHGQGRNRLKVMLAAHMDEVGLMIVSDDGGGIYQFGTVGGMDASQLAGKTVLIGRSHVPAVIGMKPIHLSGEEDGRQKIHLDSLRLDTGIINGVQVGDRAGFSTRFRRQGKIIFAKALDDRLGVATLIEILRHGPTNIDLLAAFTVQEEVGLRGAKVAAHALAPDIAIALDATRARDLPDHAGRENTVYNAKLGSGPAIYTEALHDQRLVKHFAEAGDAGGITYQIRQPGGSGNDASIMQLQLEGIPALSISVPARYIHSPISVCSMDDWQNTLRLLQAGLGSLNRSVLKR